MYTGTCTDCEELMAENSVVYNPCPWQVVGMAYVPVQKLDTVFEPMAAFDHGTLFPELRKPWHGGCCHE